MSKAMASLSGWRILIDTCSSLIGRGISHDWLKLEAYLHTVHRKIYLSLSRGRGDEGYPRIEGQYLKEKRIREGLIITPSRGVYVCVLIRCNYNFWAAWVYRYACACVGGSSLF